MPTCNFLHWQNKKRLLQGVLVGLTLGLFYHMKVTFEKEMFLLNGVIDLWYVETFTEEETAWLGELTSLHMAKIY